MENINACQKTMRCCGVEKNKREYMDSMTFCVINFQSVLSNIKVFQIQWYVKCVLRKDISWNFPLYWISFLLSGLLYIAANHKL